MAQSPWITGLNGPGADHVADIAVAADNSVVITGSFSNGIGLNGSTLFSAGGTDIVVAKFDADGNLLWWRRAGGPGTDRGTAVVLDSNGDVLVTGQFMNTSDIFGSTVTSGGGTLDIFLSKLDGANGQTLWTRTVNGPDGTVSANGMALAPSDAVVMTGEFRGNATFIGQTLTSLIDPDTQVFGADVFVAKYDATGALEWVKQGAASHDDKGVAVAVSPNGIVHVVGQFSDTLEFDVQHPSNSIDGIFLVSFDAAGQELGFARAAGSGVSQVKDIVIDPGGGMLLIGDQQGNMFWFDDQPDQILSNDPYAYFLMKVDTNRQFVSAATKGSLAPVTLRDMTLVADSVFIYGEFACQFTGLSAHYGSNALFMAVGAKDLFISRHRRSDLALEKAQQFGGQGDKRAGRIAYQDALGAVFTGSYSVRLLLPSNNEQWGDRPIPDTCHVYSVNQNVALCGDPHYGLFAMDTAVGLFDGFLTRGLLNGREPYDFWRRGNGPCFRDHPEVCIYDYREDPMACTDSLLGCGFAQLGILGRRSGVTAWGEPFGLCNDPHWVGPDFDIIWSDATTYNNTVTYNSGWVDCTITSTNGCYSYTDSIHVSIGQQPPLPLVSDALGTNVDAMIPQDVIVCGPSVWLWCPNVPPGFQVEWMEFGGTTVNNDSILATMTTDYVVTITSPAGCSEYNVVQVQINNGGVPPLPDLSGVEATYFTGPMGSGTLLGDTLTTCPVACITGYADLTWSVNGVPTPMDPDLLLTSYTDCTFPVPNFGDGPGTWSIGPVTTSGYYPLTMVLVMSNQPCGQDSYVAMPMDSIFVNVEPSPDVLLFGPSVLCSGDTALYIVSCFACDSVVWSGPGIVSVSPGNDSLLVTQTGVYEMFAFNLYPGGMCMGGTSFFLPEISVPVLETSPQNGAFCPGDSLLIFTNSVGTEYSWNGPNGTVTTATPYVWVDEPGEYDLLLTTVDGCVVGSTPVTVSLLGNPFISAWPTQAICDGVPVEISVFTSDSTAVQWLPPLTGGATVQVVSTPGVYSCEVLHCGALDTLSVTIQSGGAVASLVDPGPFLICPGDSVVLEAVPGPFDHLWLPSGTTGDVYVVTGASQVQLVAIDPVGCTDTSAMVQVEVIPFTQAVTVGGIAVCAGDTAQMTAVGSGSFEWFADPFLMDPLGNGTTIGIPALIGDSVYVVQSEGVCTGPPVAFAVPVLIPPIFVIQGDTVLCEGGALDLYAFLPDGDTMWWTTPQGLVAGEQVFLDDVTSSASGTYSVHGIWEGCAVGPLSVEVVVGGTPITGLPDVIDLCVGQATILAANDGYSEYQWSTGEGTPAIAVDEAGTYWVTVVSAQGCAATDTVIGIVIDCGFTVPNVFSPNGDGVNDVIFLNSAGVEHFEWNIFNRWGQRVFHQEGRTVTWNGRSGLSGIPLPEGVYFYTINFTLFGGEVQHRNGYVQLLR